MGDMQNNMSYLFFDIECANSFKGICKMCSFGYVIIDENFNIIEKKDIVMDPEAVFDYYLFKKDSEVKLAYTRDYFYSQFPFNYYYDKIKYIFSDEYDGIFGYAVGNDVKYIYEACERYNLEQIILEAYDVAQIAYAYDHLTGKLKELTENTQDTSLKLVHSHKSDDDAKMTMQLLKNMCDHLELTIEEIIDASEVKPISYRKKVQVYSKEGKKHRRLTPEQREKNELFNSYYDKQNIENQIGNLNNITFSISATIKKDLDKAIEVAEVIFNNSGMMTKSLSDSIYIVSYNEEDSKRLENTIDTTKIDIITYEELLQMI